jgi:hypothetical protein
MGRHLPLLGLRKNQNSKKEIFKHYLACTFVCMCVHVCACARVCNLVITFKEEQRVGVLENRVLGRIYGRGMK